MTKRRTFTAEYKFKVALEAAKGTKTLAELAQEYQLHPNQISEWKQHLLKNGGAVFSQDPTWRQRKQAALETELHEQIGTLKMELEWLKRSCQPPVKPNAP